MSYTKGPWKVFNDTFNKISITGEDGNDGILRVVAQLKGAPKETIQANARLIAAAPDLLEACEYVVNWHRDHDSGEGELYGLDFVTTCIAAIRKAKGE